MSVWSRVRVALLGLLFLALVVGRLANVLAPIAASLAPAVCKICHGCSVGDHEDVCDCDACHAVEEGRVAAVPSVHERAHGALAGETSFVPAPGVVVDLPSEGAPTGMSWVVPAAIHAPLSSKHPDPPVEPPPRICA